MPHLCNCGVSELDKTSVHGHLSLIVTGTVLCIFVLTMHRTTFRVVRCMISFEALFIVYLLDFLLYYSVVILHGSNDGWFSTYKFPTGPLVLYFIDLILHRF